MNKDLYVCLMGRDRSKTAANLFGGDYAGVLDTAEKKLTAEQISGADKIYVMNSYIKDQIAERFPKESKGKKVVNMNVSHPGQYMDDELVNALNLGRYGVESTY